MPPRNKNKNEALSALHIVLLIAKVFMEVLSKVLILFCFMMVTNKGEFNPIQALVGFYTTVLIMVVFNIVFNESKICFSLRYIMGNKQRNQNNDNISFVIPNFRNCNQLLQLHTQVNIKGGREEEGRGFQYVFTVLFKNYSVTMRST